MTPENSGVVARRSKAPNRQPAQRCATPVCGASPRISVRQHAFGLARERMRLIQETVRLIDPGLRILLVERMPIEGGPIERRQDVLRHERFALRRQTRDLVLNRGVGRVI